jgi:hypothetical protein
MDLTELNHVPLEKVQCGLYGALFGCIEGRISLYSMLNAVGLS